MFGVALDGPLPRVDAELSDGEVVTVGTLELRAVHTPGHSPG